MREAIRLDQSLGGIRDSSSYGAWLLGWMASTDPDRARTLAANTDLRGSERKILRQTLARTPLRAGSATERLEHALGSSQIVSRQDVANALNELSAEDPISALEFFRRTIRERPETLIHPPDLSSMSQMAAANPDGFRDLLETVTQPATKRSMTSALANVLGEQDPTGGIALVSSMPLSRNRNLAAIHLAAGWGRKDPSAAVAWARETLQGPARLRAMAAALPRDYVQAHSREVLELFIGLPEASFMFRLRDSLDSRRAESGDGGASIASLDVLDSMPTAKTVYELALRQMAETDPRAALEISAPAETGRRWSFEEDSIRAAVLGQWAMQDRQEALRWLGGQEGVFLAKAAWDPTFAEALWGIEPDDLRMALPIVMKGDDRGSLRLVQTMLAGMAARSSDELVAFTDSLPEDLAIQVAGPMMENLVATDPRRAAQELDRLPDNRFKFFERQIAKGLANLSPQEAFEFVQQVPGERRSESLYEAVLPAWIDQDWETARDWYLDLPEGTDRNHAMTTMELELCRRNEAPPAEVFERFSEITNEYERRRAIDDLLRVWRQTDVEEARRVLNESALTDKEKKILKHSVR